MKWINLNNMNFTSVVFNKENEYENLFEKKIPMHLRHPAFAQLCNLGNFWEELIRNMMSTNNIYSITI